MLKVPYYFSITRERESAINNLIHRITYQRYNNTRVMIVSLKPIKEEAATDLDYSAERIEASMVANASLPLSLYTRYHTRTVEIRIIRVNNSFFFLFQLFLRCYTL